MLYYILDFLKETKPDFYIDLEFYRETKIHYNGKDCKKPQEDGGIFDKLGYFSTESYDTIFICHDKLKKFCDGQKLSYAIVYDIICIHEYAHLIHYHHNKIKFNLFDFGFACDKCSPNSEPYNPTCLNCNKFYVETWAEWITYKICKKLDAEHETNQFSPYIKTFNFLSKGIPRQYLEYKKLLNLFILNDSDIIKLFLREDGWLADKKLLKKLHYEYLISLIKPRNQLNSSFIDWPYTNNLIKQVKAILNLEKEESELIYEKITSKKYVVGNGVKKIFNEKYPWLTINGSIFDDIKGYTDKNDDLDELIGGFKDLGIYGPDEIDEIMEKTINKP